MKIELVSKIIIAVLSLSNIFGTTISYIERAHHLLNAHALVDSHNDLPEKISGLYNGQINHVDLTHLNSTFHTDTSRMKIGGVKVQIWSAYVPCTEYNVWNDAISSTLNQIDLIHRMIKMNSDLQLATNTNEIDLAVQNGKIASLIGLEGGHSIGDSIAVLV